MSNIKKKKNKKNENEQGDDEQNELNNEDEQEKNKFEESNMEEAYLDHTLKMLHFKLSKIGTKFSKRIMVYISTEEGREEVKQEMKENKFIMEEWLGSEETTTTKITGGDNNSIGGVRQTLPLQHPFNSVIQSPEGFKTISTMLDSNKLQNTKTTTIKF